MSDFLQSKSAPSLLLIAATFAALLVKNSPFSALYDSLLSLNFSVSVGDLGISKPLLLWINDGLMAIFFFLVGLEIKREVLGGELSNRHVLILPCAGAVGGMLGPALIYTAFNYGDPEAMVGWAIPSATDIAFALGILSLLGDRVPKSLKLFLMTLAIIDDLGAILVIALFYTKGLSLGAIGMGGLFILALFILNRRGVKSLSPYLLLAVALWVSVLKSGVHATLAGVIAAFFIPHVAVEGARKTLLESLEHDLYGLVMFFILPVFAFANTGIALTGLSLEMILHPVPLGIAAGLVLGNQIGIMLACFTVIRSGLATLPDGIGWVRLYGVSALCGIGFTMSLFISSLAFESGAHDMIFDDRLGILIGSFISCMFGYWVLYKTLPK